MRDQLVLEHQDLIAEIARQCRRLLLYWRTVDEMLEAGQFGLLEAASKFDRRRGISFRAYARQRIRGSIIDVFRRRDYKWELHETLDTPAVEQPSSAMLETSPSTSSSFAP